MQWYHQSFKLHPESPVLGSTEGAVAVEPRWSRGSHSTEGAHRYRNISLRLLSATSHQRIRVRLKYCRFVAVGIGKSRERDGQSAVAQHRSYVSRRHSATSHTIPTASRDKTVLHFLAQSHCQCQRWLPTGSPEGSRVERHFFQIRLALHLRILSKDIHCNSSTILHRSRRYRSGGVTTWKTPRKQRLA